MIDLEMFEKSKPSMDLTPMIDMIFLLLIFFMLTSVFKLPGVETQLPESDTAKPVQQHEVVVSITGNNDVYVGKEKVPMDVLEMYLVNRFQQQTEKVLVISSDKKVSFERIMAVMDTANKAGAESIAFLTEVKADVQ